MSSVSRSVGRPVTRSVLAGQLNNLASIIKSIFAVGEQGFAYDPNDLSTMYQDAAGTIPVTAVGQPVGLIKDKSGRNNHAFQTVSASRPILRQTPILGNELVANGDFSSGLTNVAPRNVVTTEIVTGALKITNAGTLYGFAEMTLPTEVGKTYLFRGDVMESSGTGAAFHIASVTNSNDIANNVEGSTAAKGVTFTAKTTTTYLSLKTPSNATGAWRIFDNMSIKEVTGYRTDQNYLEFDGVDDFLQTNSIDFTATDKISLFAGVRKLSDATTQMILTYGANTSVAGTFNLFRGGLATQHYVAEVRGGTNITAITANSSEHAAPVSNVVSEKMDLSGATKLRLRVNSVQVGSSIANLGGGNFSNQPLYIGRRGDASLPFNGHIYSLIGIGRLTTDSETIALEKAIAKNTGVTI